jgi:hypothetical protein
MSADTSVRHTPKVPPVPELVQISAAEHAGTLTSGAYDRIAFTFTRAFPSSDFWYSNTLLTVGEGAVIPRRPNTIWLGISFMVAQAHTSSGHSSILSQPPATIGEHRLVGFVQAGDFEGGLNYGLAIAYPLAANGQVPVRVVEVATVSSTGQHLFTVAFDFPVK